MKMSLSKTESEATLTSQTSSSSLTNIASLPPPSLPTPSLPTLKRTWSTKSLRVENVQDSFQSFKRSLSRISLRFKNPGNSPETAGTAVETLVFDPQPSPPNELTQPKAQESLLTYYKNELDLEYHHRGSAIIFNFQRFKKNDYRAGSEYDVANLEFLFKRMELTVFKHENLTKKQFLKSLEEFAKYDGHKNGSMIYVAILSHGDNNVIETYDGKMVNLDVDVYPMFYHDAAPNLIKTPKNFIIQSCRGDNEQQGIYHDNTSPNGVKVIPNVSDISIVYSTIPLNVSYRKATGTWLISSFCDVLGRLGNSYKYNELLMMVSQSVQEKSSLNGKKMTIEINYRGFDSYLQLKLLTPEEVHEKDEKEKEKKSWGRRLRSSLRSLPSFFERK